MRINDYVMTPRFCTVRIAQVFETKIDAVEAGFEEATHYQNSEYGILGKSIGNNRMIFAAYKK